MPDCGVSNTNYITNLCREREREEEREREGGGGEVLSWIK